MADPNQSETQAQNTAKDNLQNVKAQAEAIKMARQATGLSEDKAKEEEAGETSKALKGGGVAIGAACAAAFFPPLMIPAILLAIGAAAYSAKKGVDSHVKGTRAQNIAAMNDKMMDAAMGVFDADTKGKEDAAIKKFAETAKELGYEVDPKKLKEGLEKLEMEGDLKLVDGKIQGEIKLHLGGDEPLAFNVKEQDGGKIAYSMEGQQLGVVEREQFDAMLKNATENPELMKFADHEKNGHISFKTKRTGVMSKSHEVTIEKTFEVNQDNLAQYFDKSADAQALYEGGNQLKDGEKRECKGKDGKKFTVEKADDGYKITKTEKTKLKKQNLKQAFSQNLKAAKSPSDDLLNGELDKDAVQDFLNNHSIITTVKDGKATLEFKGPEKSDIYDISLNGEMVRIKKQGEDTTIEMPKDKFASVFGGLTGGESLGEIADRNYTTEVSGQNIKKTFRLKDRKSREGIAEGVNEFLELDGDKKITKEGLAALKSDRTQDISQEDGTVIKLSYDKEGDPPYKATIEKNSLVNLTTLEETFIGMAKDQALSAAVLDKSSNTLAGNGQPDAEKHSLAAKAHKSADAAASRATPAAARPEPGQGSGQGPG